jgi:hypothetical protein
MASNKHSGMNGQSEKGKAVSLNTSIHPRRPRLTDLGVEIPRDSDGAFRAEKRLDGKLLNLRGAKSLFNNGTKKEDGSPSSFVSE